MAQTAICIGAGVIGMCSAYALARRGWQVTVIDSEAGPAMGTSHANGAQLSYCYADALGSPAVLRSLPSLMLGNGGVRFGVSLRPSYLFWLAQFARNCSNRRFRENTLAVLELAAESRRAMDALCETHELDFAHRVAGKVHLLYSDKDWCHAEKLRILKEEAGCVQTIIPRSEFAKLDPALMGLDHAVTGAISTPSEVVGDPLMFCQALLDVLTTDYGVRARFETRVAVIDEKQGQGRLTLSNGEELTADHIIVTSGMGSAPLLKSVAGPIAVQPMKGYSFEMPLGPGSPRISVTDGKRRLVFSNLGDRIRVAGIAELGNAARSIDADRIEWLVTAAKESLPEGGNFDQASGFWSGLRPSTPNSQPIIRRASETVAINTGHGALGWTLAMGSGERLAEMLGA